MLSSSCIVMAVSGRKGEINMAPNGTPGTAPCRPARCAEQSCHLRTSTSPGPGRLGRMVSGGLAVGAVVGHRRSLGLDLGASTVVHRQQSR